MACFHNESVQESRLFLLFAIYTRFLRKSFKEDLYFFCHITYICISFLHVFLAVFLGRYLLLWTATGMLNPGAVSGC